MPQWFKASHFVAYWDKFGRPETKPRFALGFLDTWWVDPAREAALEAARGTDPRVAADPLRHVRLHHPALAADHPDAVRASWSSTSPWCRWCQAGPVEQLIAQLTGTAVEATARFGGGAGAEVGGGTAPQTGSGDASATSQIPRRPRPRSRVHQGDRGAVYGFDKPPGERFVHMLGNYIQFDFGNSYFRDRSVVDLVLDKIPVSISLGLWTTLLAYLISIPLGIRKAVRDGTRFDVWTSGAIIVGNAIPSFLFAILLIVLFAGGSYYNIFPLRGLHSEAYSSLGFVGCISSLGCIADYFWHITLPIVAMALGGFAALTMLTKNSFLDEINKQYVLTARAKGLSERRVLYGHVFRNGMLIVVAGFPGAFIGVLFTGSLLIEVIFSLDGLGLLGFEAVINRDYPVMLGTLFFYTLFGLILGLISDLMYVIIDPRIDFEKREA